MIAFMKRNPRFFRFWLATWASDLGDWVRNITMMFLVLDLSKGSALSLSFNLFCEYAPIFLFGLFVGALADRWNRQRTVMGAILFRALIMALLVVAYLNGSLYMIYACAFVSAIGTLFFRSSNMGFFMLFVDAEDRKYATSLRQASSSAVQLLGPTAGAAFYLLIGASGGLAVTVTLFLVAVWLLSTIRVDQPESSKVRTFSGIWVDVKAGFQYSWGNSYVRPVLFVYMMYGMAAGIINVLEVFIVTDFLGLPKEMMAILASVQGAGMFVSSLIIGKLKVPLHRMVSMGMLIAGAFLAGMVAVNNFYMTAASLVVFSFGLMMVNVGITTILQTKVDFTFQGRTQMSASTVFNGFMVMTMLSSGWLLKAFTIRPVILLSGGLAALSGVVLFAIFSRVIRRENGVGAPNTEAA
ncbi:MFS transporter [Tumebacillus sp. ITR2]|uniref:MFS transporter n=1 Tax=Tumebacillus amylolyticus TaxID=2801339 RepID=A0ABS1J8T5_9BACL|nr:MFS transporter [Tumebacillus amylolyticus]MBL0386688.1 MFS transporter [Tumebacillus amylolyticus]